ncbi:hypothetical protein [Dactylosporangium sp. NPDC005555]|uniref:hypothetical protein n=1 Tax=Dactylosporangium sp. NPDC005555 TaxID=3154889 RepID=UPI0033B4304F
MREPQELLYRDSTPGASTVVSLLTRHGQLDVLRRMADAGDWDCADALGAELLARGDVDGALGVYRPFVAPGAFTPAVARIAAVQGEAGVDLVRPFAVAGDPDAVRCTGELLARLGRVDDVIELLRPRLHDPSSAAALVRLSEGHGRDAEVAALLREAADASVALAAVLERQGHVSEAAAVLRAADPSVDALEHLADLLARHDQAGLVRLAAESGHPAAVHRLAALLDRQGQVDEAAKVLWPLVTAGEAFAVHQLADLLTRHDRAGEAVELMRPFATQDPEQYLDGLVAPLVRAGRAEEALSIVDNLVTRPDLDLMSLRTFLLHALGRLDDAYLQTLPEHHRGYAAELLADAGRWDEAIALLWPGRRDHDAGTTVAELLIRQGRVDEAIEILAGRGQAGSGGGASLV